jgi:hypothetical protein
MRRLVALALPVAIAITPAAHADDSGYLEPLAPPTMSTGVSSADSQLLELIVGCFRRASEGSVSEDRFCDAIGQMLSTPGMEEPEPPIDQSIPADLPPSDQEG